LSGTLRVTLTLFVFASMLLLVVLRPRRWNEAWWTVLGASALLALRLISPADAVHATLAGQSALWFLLSLLLLSLLVGKSGFFDWAAIQCARVAKGDAHVLYRNAFLLGAIVTVTLSLDTTAVILTPVVIALVKRLELPAAPYIVLCAFVSNVASLLLPISNLTNILFASAFQLTFAAFALKMLAPQLVTLALTYGLLRWSFRAELPARFAFDSLPSAASVVPSRPYFLACVSVLACVLAGYFVAPLLGVAPYVVAFAGVLVLIFFGWATKRVHWTHVREVSWGVFPFVVGLFIAVRGLEQLGAGHAAARWFAIDGGGPWGPLLAAGSTALAANIANNLPAALLARGVLLEAHASLGCVLGSLIGANAGSIITPFGSLATLLVLTSARQQGIEVPAWRLMRLALWGAPVIVIGATITLTLLN